jgi:hypothetical protein
MVSEIPPPEHLAASRLQSTPTTTHFTEFCRTPLYIASGGGQSPELIYRWNPWIIGEVHDHLSWWEIPPEHHDAIVGVKMSVWQTDPHTTLCALASRLPAMSDRSWNPQAGRSYADYQVRVNATTYLLGKLLATLPPPPPPPTPPPSPAPVPPLAPAAGFTVGFGDCRDRNGGYGSRLERNGAVDLLTCQNFCLHLGDRCDAYDFGVSSPNSTVGIWCGAWGTSLTSNDNQVRITANMCMHRSFSICTCCDHRQDTHVKLWCAATDV